MPTARPIMPNVMKNKVTEDRIIINKVDFKNQPEIKFIDSARTKSGTRFVQNLFHKKVRRETGVERMTQKGNPSWLTEGKANLPEIVAKTNPASPIFMKKT